LFDVNAVKHYCETAGKKTMKRVPRTQNPITFYQIICD